MTSSYHKDRDIASFACLVRGIIVMWYACQRRLGRATKVREEIALLDNSNPDYFQDLGDRRAMGRAALIVLVFLLSLLIDYLLVATGVEIICRSVHLPVIFKYVVPASLIVVEVGVAYFTVLRVREGAGTALGRLLQYFVIVIIWALCVLACLYGAWGYNPAFDGDSQFLYILSHSFVQLLLLVAGSLLHVFIIRHAENIAESLFFFAYCIKRSAKARTLSGLERGNNRRCVQPFAEKTSLLYRRKAELDRRYPGACDSIIEGIPKSVIQSMELVMGKPMVAGSVEYVEYTETKLK